jgi:hypothetical protein
MFDDQQRVAFVRQPLQRIEQYFVVARMQTDSRLVQDVTHPLQIRAQLGGETNALRFATRERGRGAIQ